MNARPDNRNFIRWATNKDRWRASIRSFLSRAGVDQDYVRAYCAPSRPNLPPGATELLTSSNPRLIELRRRYEQIPHAGAARSQWSQEYVDADVPLLSFRRDSALCWQHRDFNVPANYFLTYYYLLSRGYGPLLAKLLEDDLFGAYTLQTEDGLVSRDRLDSACEIALLAEVLGMAESSHVRILDIGSGYGRFAHRLAQAYRNAEIWCVDAIPEVCFLCEYYLHFRGVGSRAATVPLFDLEERLDSIEFDAAVNFHSFSECPYAAIRWWVHLLKRQSVRYVLIAPNAEAHGGAELLSMEIDQSRLDYLPILKAAGYRCKLAEPKYAHKEVQQLGVSPTHYHVFELT